MLGCSATKQDEIEEMMGRREVRLVTASGEGGSSGADGKAQCRAAELCAEQLALDAARGLIGK